MTVRCRENDLCPQDKLARRVAVGGQSLKLSTVGGAKVKADAGASHPPTMPRQSKIGNPTSGAEHYAGPVVAGCTVTPKQKLYREAAFCSDRPVKVLWRGADGLGSKDMTANCVG